MTLEELNVFCGEMYKRLEFKSHTERLPEAYFAETSTAAREGHPVTEWLAVPSSTADLNPIDLATLSHRPQPFRVIQPGQLRRLWNA
jgi:hypothetical protein